MKYYYAIFLLLILGSVCAQKPVWDWAINPVQEHNAYRLRNGITVDGFGNCFILGDSHGPQSNPSLLNDSGAFIARFNKFGQLTWAKKVEGQPAAICADASGNLYVGGNYYNNHSISPGKVTDGAFLKKYDHTGNVLWEYKSKNKYTSVAAIAVGASGRVFVTGSKADTMTLGSFKLSGKHLFFAACFSPAGNVVWAKTGDVVPDTTYSFVNGNQIALDQYENVYTTYTYGYCPGYGCVDAYFLKLDSQGKYILHKKYSGYNGDCNGIAVEANGEVIASHCLSAWTSGGSYVLRRYKSDFSSFYWEKTVAVWQCQDLFMDSKPVLSGSSDLFIAGSAGWFCGSPGKGKKMGFGSDTIVIDSLVDIVLCRIDRLTGNYTGVWHVPGKDGERIGQLAGDKFGNIYAAGGFNTQPGPDTLCFDQHCLSSGYPKSQLFLAKLKVSNQDFNDDVGVRDVGGNHSFLAPNPTSGILFLHHHTLPRLIECSDIMGRSFNSLEVSEKGLINISNLPPGVYVFYLPTKNGTAVQKIVKAQ